ncbi:hypothetical protein F5Y16DRAFT_365524 [Xylariaceae sp. FL0255]|nr:hypothetical protein F5Y16DRAFT_365524 [Xylariaceae sp. FL0255]
MCTTTHFLSRRCGHHWLAIRQPCWPGYGFSYCSTFGDGVAREPAPEVEVVDLCPSCLSPPGYTSYDPNLVRMIVDVRSRYRWGLGPSKDDLGIECVVM